MASVEAMVASLKEFGFRHPIVVDGESVIVCGHTRYKAALKLGLEKVPVHVAKDLSPEQIRAYRIADNKSAELSDWDYDLLPIELAGLQEMNYDLDLLGFDPDDVPEPPEKAKPTTKKLRPKDRPLANDFVSDEAFDGLLDAWFGNMARVLEPGRGFTIWGGYANLGNYPPFLKKHGLTFSQGIVWDKQHPVLTRKDGRGSRVEQMGFGWGRGKVWQP